MPPQRFRATSICFATTFWVLSAPCKTASAIETNSAYPNSELVQELEIIARAGALQDDDDDVPIQNISLPIGNAVSSPTQILNNYSSEPRFGNEMLKNLFVAFSTAALIIFMALIAFYALRHYLLTLNRLFGRQRHPLLDIDTAQWPTLTMLVAAHNEEAVIAGSLKSLLDADYPKNKLTIVPVNDRSSDRTKEIIDQFASRNPGLIKPFHRAAGKPGKAAALKDACSQVNSEIIVVFDADYLPPRGLLKQLVSPFFDPEIGATMGRVVPLNAGKNLLTRLLDLERSGGYQVDQQARMNLGLVPQYGGTVGGVRVRALNGVGGWHDDILAEDTDLTYRLLLGGWKIAYQNRAECYEEVPENWNARIRQIKRWAKGHNQAAYRHAGDLLLDTKITLREKIDALAVLGTYAMAPALLVAWLLVICMFYLGGIEFVGGATALIIGMSFGALGNFAAFFEIAAAVYLDGNRKRVTLLPLGYFTFFVSAISISRALLDQVGDVLLNRGLNWEKTPRYRKAG